MRMEEYWEGPKYENRHHAGLVLAERLQPHDWPQPVVLAVPNGGVAVAIPVAQALACPLHLMVVRKLQIPDQPEAGFGSVASDGTLLLNEPVVRRVGLTEEIIAAQKEKALRTIHERLRRYGGAAEFPELRTKTVILVDDGLASGFTMEAAVEVAGKHHPGKVIVAVPTSSRSAFRRLSRLVDKVICPDVSRVPIFAVANAYREWRDLKDDEVVELLKAAHPSGH